MEAVMKSKQLEPVVPVIDASVLPKGWRLTTIDAVCGKVEKTDPTQRPNTEFKYIDIGGIDNQALRIVDTKAYLGKDAPSRARQVVKAHDVVVSTVRTYLKNIALVPEELDGEVCSTGFCVLRGGNEWMGKYLFYFVQSDAVLKEIGKQQRGTSYPAVRDSDIKAQFIPLAPLPEQRRIVSAIETQLGRLDAAVARLHAAKARLKRYKQAVLKAAFSEGEPTRLEELCEFITKGTTPTKTMFSEKGTVPFIKVYNLTRDGSLDFSVDPTFVEQSVHEKFLARSIVYPGDLLMNIVGPPLGKVSLVPDDYPEWNINQAIVRYRTKEKLRTKYLMYYLLCDSTAQELMATTKATAGQFNLTLAHCRDLEIPLVPLDEQDFVIEHLEQRVGVIDETEATLDAQLLQGARLRQAVLKRAFEGRLV
jgi:type I restriction enzyme S subunit